MDKIIPNLKIFTAQGFGNSMLPLIKNNDQLIIKKLPFKNIQINDIVVFKKNNQIISHRVVYKTKNYLYTQGDNNHFNDGKISKNQIIGKVEKIQRNKKIINLKELYLIQATNYLNQISNIINLFNKNKIDYLILKGIPVYLYYQNYSIPQMIHYDCDFLIKKKDYPKAKKILINLKYQEIKKNIFLETHNKEKEVSFIKKTSSWTIIIDLHFEPVFLMTQVSQLNNLYPKKLIELMTNDFYQNKKEITVNNLKINILKKHYFIYYLLLHYFHHNFKGIQRLNIINLITKKERFGKNDWLKVLKIANKYKTSSFIKLGLFLLKKLTKNKVIPKVIIKKSPFVKNNSYLLSEQSRIKEGVIRFLNIFFLSEEPFFKKILIFLNPEIIQFIIKIFKIKLFSFFSNRLKKIQNL